MDFQRKRKRGSRATTEKFWFSPEQYRIVWRREVYGIPVSPRFQATVRVLVPATDGVPRQMWDFVNPKRRLFKTFATAQEECEKHQRLWVKVCEATGIRALRELCGGKLPSGLPLWTRKNIDRRLYAILMDGRPARGRNDAEDKESATESSQPASG